jgi:acid phosphatase type 7
MQKKAFYRIACLFTLIILLVGTNLVVYASPDPAHGNAPAATFKPVADAYVISTSTTTNYGTNASLRVDGSPVTVSYLRFVVTGLNGASLQSAVLRIFANSANSTGYSVKAVANNTWVENQINYSNAPAAGNTISSSKAFGAGVWVDVDISSYVKAEGTFSLALITTSTTNTNLAARESGANAPQLVLTTVGQATATPIQSPTGTSVPTATPISTITSTPTPFPTDIGPGSLLLKPVLDAYTIQTSPTTNYGTSTSLRVDGSPITRSYLRFVVSGLNDAGIQSAVLRIYARSANTTGFSVQAVADNTWLENKLTYSNAPVVGSTINTSKAFGANVWVALDISSYIQGEGSYNLALTTTSTTNTNLASRESGAYAPQLVLTRASDILLMAGDICRYDLDGTDYTANCRKTGDLIRSELAANRGAQVQTLGDNVNNEPAPASYDAQYQELYAPNWGSFLNVTHSLEGNHDFLPPGGSGPYFDYFGAAAGPRPGGYYSYEIGPSWHVVVLNAECSQAGGCGGGSSQYDWLQNDLAANTKPCLLAVWHQPRWTSGQFTGYDTIASWWSLLYQYKADIVANAHNHNYERFEQIDDLEQAAADGIREFVVGTGGSPGSAYTYASHPLDPNEAIRNQSIVYGVLKLTLLANSYSWNFLPAVGYTFTDSGTSTCH